MQITRRFTREGTARFVKITLAGLCTLPAYYIESASMLVLLAVVLLAAILYFLCQIGLGVLRLIALSKVLKKLRPGDEMEFTSTLVSTRVTPRLLFPSSEAANSKLQPSEATKPERDQIGELPKSGVAGDYCKSEKAPRTVKSSSARCAATVKKKKLPDS